MSGQITTLDLGVLVVYLLGTTALGVWLGRGQKGGTDYFLGGRDLPWLAVMLSVVATETSTLTFLSIPGVAYVGTLAFLQLTVGYLVGRAVVAAVLIPAYYRGTLSTAYALLEDRFGVATRRTTSGIFMVTRLLADSVRLFATAIPLSFMTGWPFWVSIGVIGVLTVIYTFFGGIRAVVWVDALQMGLYMLGAVAAALALQALVPGGWPSILGDAAAAGKLQVLDFSTDVSVAYTFWAGLVGGAFLSMGSHGTDQLIVQRLLTCRDVRSSQMALVGSGLGVIVQFAVFLLVGIGLWAFYGGMPFERSDAIFARFIVESLPPGVTGLLVAGVLAAAMSSLSSSINSLASASAYDFWAPLRGTDDDRRIFRAGRLFTLLWAGALMVGAVVFERMGEGAAAVEVALGIASLVYGGLLGAFFLGVVMPRIRQAAVIGGMAAGIGTVTVIWLAGRSDLAASVACADPGLLGPVCWVSANPVGWPWFVLVGTVVTSAVGAVLGRVLEEEIPPGGAGEAR